nr:immunoglobulin heavy chain junction region [Macaca mulatta]
CARDPTVAIFAVDVKWGGKYDYW